MSDGAEFQTEATELARMIARRRADHRSIPHGEVREWLWRLASGELTAKPPSER